MGNVKLEELLETLKERNNSEYTKALDMLDFLKEVRVSFVGNGLRNMLGRTPKSIDWVKVMSYVKQLNELARAYGVELQIPENEEGVKKYLRYTILEDVQAEFKRQSK